MEMPTPSDFHKALDVLVGQWIGKETMHPSPWDPVGCVADAEIENKAALDGFAILQDYAQKRDGVVSFRGLGVITYDMHAGHFSLMWWDSMGTPANDFVGHFEGQSLVLFNENPMGRSRATMDLSKAAEGHYSFVMELSQDGESWAPLIEGAYDRA